MQPKLTLVGLRNIKTVVVQRHNPEEAISFQYEI